MTEPWICNRCLHREPHACQDQAGCWCGPCRAQDAAPFPAHGECPTTQSAHIADEPTTTRLWRVRLTGAGRPDALVTTHELDPYYRRNDVFEITPA